MVDFIKINSGRGYYRSAYVDEPIYGYYPPILDYNPIFAAQSLTIEDTEIAYKILNDCFFNLTKDKYPILENSILYSVENFIWFTTFFKKVEEIYTEGKEDMKLPYDLMPEENNGLRFQPPYKVKDDRKYSKGYMLFPYTFKLRSEDPVNRYRVVYILRDLELAEFYDGFPGWYLMKDTTVFEKYNEKTNVRTRIDFRNGEFTYFVAGASDAWLQVQGVPLEIDDIVSAILLR